MGILPRRGCHLELESIGVNSFHPEKVGTFWELLKLSQGKGRDSPCYEQLTQYGVIYIWLDKKYNKARFLFPERLPHYTFVLSSFLSKYKPHCNGIQSDLATSMFTETLEGAIKHQSSFSPDKRKWKFLQTQARENRNWVSLKCMIVFVRLPPPPHLSI